jgi:hypothetical protein
VVSSTNKTDHHDTTEILLKVALNTINPKPNPQEERVRIPLTDLTAPHALCLSLAKTWISNVILTNFIT